MTKQEALGKVVGAYAYMHLQSVYFETDAWRDALYILSATGESLEIEIEAAHEVANA